MNKVYVVCDSNDTDDKTREWVKFPEKDYKDAKQRAEDWVENFNVNARRKRDFIIEEREHSNG